MLAVSRGKDVGLHVVHVDGPEEKWRKVQTRITERVTYGTAAQSEARVPLGRTVTLALPEAKWWTFAVKTSNCRQFQQPPAAHTVLDFTRDTFISGLTVYVCI